MQETNELLKKILELGKKNLSATALVNINVLEILQPPPHLPPNVLASTSEPQLKILASPNNNPDTDPSAAPILTSAPLKTNLAPVSPSPLEGDTKDIKEKKDTVETKVGLEIRTIHARLKKKLLNDEPSSIAFLADMVKDNEKIMLGLLEIVYVTRTDDSDEAEIAAANAMSILSAAGFCFSGRDLNRVRIRRAILIDGVFDHTLFQYADLRGVNFTRAWTRKMDVENAKMTGIIWGGLPCYEINVSYYSFSADQSVMMQISGSSYDDMRINIFNLATWEKIEIKINKELEDIKNYHFVDSNVLEKISKHKFSVKPEKIEYRVPVAKLSPNGKILVVQVLVKINTYAEFNILNLYDVKTQVVLYKMLCGGDHSFYFDFSPDSRLLMTDKGGRDGMNVLDLTTMKEVFAEQRFRRNNGYIAPVFTPDSRWLLAYPDVYDTTFGKLVSSYDEALRESGNQPLAWKNKLFIPQGQLLTWRGDDEPYKLSLWDRKDYSFKLLHSFNSDPNREYGSFQSFSISRDGKCLAISGMNLGYRSQYDIIQLWEISSGKLLRQSKEFHLKGLGRKNKLVFSPDGQTLMVMLPDENKKILMMNVATLEIMKVIFVKIPLVDIVFDLDGQHLICVLSEGRGNGRIEKMVLAEEGLSPSVLSGFLTKENACMAVDPTGRSHAIWNCGVIKLWDANFKQLQHSFEGPALRTVHELIFSPDGKYLVDDASNRGFENDYVYNNCYEGVNINIRVWDIATKKLVHIFEWQEEVAKNSDKRYYATTGAASSGLKFSDKGEYLAVHLNKAGRNNNRDRSKTVIFNMAIGKRVCELEGYSFMEDSIHGFITYDKDGNMLSRIKPNGITLPVGRFSKNGRYRIESFDEWTRLRDLKTDKEVCILKDELVFEDFMDVDFDVDSSNQYLVSLSKVRRYGSVFDLNKKLQLWDLKTKKVIAVMEDSPFISVSFLQSEKEPKDLIVTADSEGTIYIWKFSVLDNMATIILQKKIGHTSFYAWGASFHCASIDERGQQLMEQAGASQLGAARIPELQRELKAGLETKQIKEKNRWEMEEDKKGLEELYLRALIFQNGIGVQKNDETALKWFIRAAECGHTDAAIYSGICYQIGQGTPQNLESAHKWYQTAEQYIRSGTLCQDANTQYHLGLCYESGCGLAKDRSKAATWIVRSAAQGHREAVNWVLKNAELDNEDAQCCLANFYYHGHNVGPTNIQQNIERAIVWYQKAAQNGSAEAQYQLGLAYEAGNGVTKNESLAASHYMNAAIQDYHDAQYRLGICYEEGRGLGKDLDKAFRSYTRAAEQGNCDAQNRLGVWFEKGIGTAVDIEKAKEWYKKAGGNGSAEALFNLGICNKSDYYLEEAAKKMHIAAQCALADCYAGGEGVNMNWDKAFNWYMKAALHGSPYAQCKLGKYYTGYGVKSFKEAFKWFLKAAEQGNLEAQCNLGDLFKESEDYKKAEEWYALAAEQGNAVAQYWLGQLMDSSKGLEWMQKAYLQGNKDAEEYLCSYYMEKFQLDNYSYKKNRFRPEERKYDQQIMKAAHAFFVELLSKLNKDLATEDAEKKEEIEGTENVEGEKEIYIFGYGDKERRRDIEFHLGVCYEYGLGVAADLKSSAEFYTKAAKHGNYSAQFSLAIFYEQGLGVPRDLKQSLNYYAKFIRAKKFPKDYQKGWKWFLNNNNKGTNGIRYLKDFDPYAPTSFLKVVEQHIAGLQNILANNAAQLPTTVDLQKNKEKQKKLTLENYIQAAERGEPEANFQLGLFYQFGRGVDKDSKKAKEYYLSAAEKGNEDAQNVLALYFEQSDKPGSILSNAYSNASSSEKAIESSTNKVTEASANVEFTSETKENHEMRNVHHEVKVFREVYPNARKENTNNNIQKGLKKASTNSINVEQLKKEARQGNLAAQEKLADCYYFGEGVAQDLKLAEEMYIRIAELGDFKAKRTLADRYKYGRGVVIDIQKASEWFKKAEEVAPKLKPKDEKPKEIKDTIESKENKESKDSKENKESTQQLSLTLSKSTVIEDEITKLNNQGVCYLEASGVAQDFKRAVECFNLAAEQGNAKAQNNLGNCYKDGIGVPKDLGKALQWYVKAARQDFTYNEPQTNDEEVDKSAEPKKDEASEENFGKGLALKDFKKLYAKKMGVWRNPSVK